MLSLLTTNATKALLVNTWVRKTETKKSCWKEMMRKQVLGKGKWNLLVLIQILV